jgi:hypothetical protein
VLERTGLVLGEDDNLSCSFSEAFEQPSRPFRLLPSPCYRTGREVLPCCL